jgi:hypothetical protein
MYYRDRQRDRDKDIKRERSSVACESRVSLCQNIRTFNRRCSIGGGILSNTYIAVCGSAWR